MKKIAFISKRMDIGGVEKVALSILKQLDEDLYSVDYYYNKYGEREGVLFSEIPKWINKKEIIIPNRHTYKDVCTNMYQRIRFCYRYLWLYVNRNAGWSQYSRMLVKTAIVDNKSKYDMAITFVGPRENEVFYTINNINACVKVLWIHGDINREGITSKNKIMEKCYDAYDYIIAVSENAKDILCKTFPRLSQKVSVIYNYVDCLAIKKMSLECTNLYDEFEGLKIATVGRLAYDKGMIMAIKCCKMLKDKGVKVKWILCGDGPLRGELENAIEENDLKEELILAGNLLNPYSVVRKCDIYVQPSIQEGFCTASNEAKVLCKPIVVTDVCGMREQVEHGVTGLIVDISAEAICEGICVYYDNPTFRRSVEVELEKCKWNCEANYNEIIRGFLRNG